MLSRYLIGLSLLFLCELVQAQNYTLSTSNKYVLAKVEAGSGYISISIPPPGPQAPRLSYDGKSFLTVNINGRIFTNNNIGTNIQTDSRFAGYLTNGINQKVGDTITTTWYNRDGCDIIQEVYPVMLDTSGQIVMRWKIRNNTQIPIFAQAQFLLDLQVGSNANDASPVLTRNGYHPIWEQYDGSIGDIPWYFAAFERRPSGDPGVIGAGYTHDVNYKLGLKKPLVLTIGDWAQPYGRALVDYLWGPPPDAPWGQNYEDAAILYMWEAVGAFPKKTVEMGRTSYGTPEFTFCYGNLFGILFYPKHFKWKEPRYNPDTATVEFYAFNTYSPIPNTPDFGPASQNTRLKLHVGPSLRIVDPLPSNNGKTQTQLTSPAYIPQRGVGTAFWKVVADKALDCNEQVESWFKFTCESSLDPPVFQNSGVADTCEHPIIVDCTDEDRNPPLVKNELKTTSFPFIDSFTVVDDRSTDRGIDKVQWVATPGSNTDLSKFTITMTPAYVPCYRKPYTIAITQLDSTSGGCFDFTFIDCAGNDTTYTFCLAPHPVPIIPDTLPPLITTVERTSGYTGAQPCNGRCDSLLLTDSRKNDKGLKRVEVIAVNNMDLRIQPFTEGLAIHRAKVCVFDTMLDASMTLRVWDVADNYTDTTYTYCTVPDTLAPLVTVNDDPLNRGHWMIVVEENRDWDRRIDSIAVYKLKNVFISFAPSYTFRNEKFYPIEVSIIDSTKNAGFCVKALDLAGNWSEEQCYSLNPDPDTLCPNFETPVITPFMSSISVKINDYHVNANGDTIGWDKGIDSVWFRNVRGIRVPDPMSIDCQMTIPAFTMSVEDTLNVDSIACATVHVLDCAGNTCSFTWCYPYNPDTLPPFIRARYTTKTNIELTVSDSELYDRGIHQIVLTGHDNFSPLIVEAERSLWWGPGALSREYGRSSVGTITATDYWGSLAFSPTTKENHTASIDLSVWVQDFAMKKGIIVTEPVMFEIPINIVRNDTFDLERKGIDAFEFTFRMTGNPEALQFTGVRMTGTASDGWTISPIVNNDLITIKGEKPNGANSLRNDGSDLLLALEFTPIKAEQSQEVIFAVEQTQGETILYNNGADRIVVGKSAYATLPAPYGTLSGAHIVIPGTCAPLLDAGGPARTVISLEQNSPNPFSTSSTFHFAIKEDGLVKLALYDLLGREVGVIVNGVLSPGRYSASIDGLKYGSGAYIVRLEANGAIRSRMIRIEH